MRPAHTTASLALVVTALTLFLAACGDGKPPAPAPAPGPKPAGAPAASLPADLFLAASPGAPKPVAQVKKDAKEGDEVIIRVTVGGEAKPFVDSLASMMVVDASQPSCAATPGDSCPTPWDFCCTPSEELALNRATVQALDKDGKPVKSPFSAGDRVKPHDTLVVRGKVGPRPDPKVLTINASGIYIESSLGKK